MRDIVRPPSAAVDVEDLIAAYLRICADIDDHDPHDRLLPVRTALRREADWLRSRLIPQSVGEQVEEVLS
jgi:hypothetical protein